MTTKTMLIMGSALGAAAGAYWVFKNKRWPIQRRAAMPKKATEGTNRQNKREGSFQRPEPSTETL